LIFTAYENQELPTVNVNIYFHDEDDATAPTSEADGEGRSLTSAVAWNSIPSWTDGEKGSDTTSPDISSILQDVIDRAGWNSGQAVCVQLIDNGSTNPRIMSTIEYNSGTEKAELYVEWTT
jgi:hypothetical protein